MIFKGFICVFAPFNLMLNVINKMICYTNHLLGKYIKQDLSQTETDRSQAILFSLRMVSEQQRQRGARRLLANVAVMAIQSNQ